jgi:aspartate/tyrosine/aromatic aminotransferase
MTATVQTLDVASAKAVAPQTRTVLFITGAWMHTSSWDKFRSAFEAAGYKTIAPAWPYLDASTRRLSARSWITTPRSSRPLTNSP